MGATQIYSVVNTIANNIGYTGATVVDVSSFVAFGQNGITGNVESVYNTLIDIIGRTIYAIDEADDEDDGIVVDAFEYGAILQKLSFTTQAAETSSMWDIASPQNPYTITGNSGIVQKFFEQTIPAFAWVDVSYDRQLREAFRSPESLAGFTDALYIRMRNAYKIAKKGLAKNAKGSLMATIYNDTTDANYSRRVRHLLTEYNTDYGTSLTSDTSYADAGYKEYVRKTILIDKENLNEMTHLYNTIGASGSEVPIDRRSTEDDIRLDLSIAFTASFDKYYGDTFNEEYVQLPKHRKMVNWGIATSPAEVKVTLDGGQTTTDITNVLGFMYDKDGVVATMDNVRFISIYDEWNARTCFKLDGERRYINDPTENAIIYLND